MPLLEAVGKPILAGNCQDENQKRKFMSRLWHRIAASLFLPLLGQSRFKYGDPGGLLLDDGEQLDDQLAHQEQCLFPTGGIQRKPCWKWERNHRYILSYHANGSLHCSGAPFEQSTHVISALHLRQRSFRLREPERHLHGAVEVDGSGQGDAALLPTAGLAVQPA
jgi:hypothetical protein